MDLEAVTAVLRPRQPWEAVDLGFSLVRRWWRPLYAAWFAVLLPLVVLLHLLCFQALWLVPWLLWWLKPLLDRIPLYILSHTLFGDTPDLRRLWRDLPRLLLSQALPALTFARFDLARSFHLPVWQLEGLRGRERRRRQRLLDRPRRSAATWLTLTCLHLEFAADLALAGLVWLLLPDFVAVDLGDLLNDSSALQQIWITSAGLFGLSLIEPFYVAAGFSLYLNRRTWLEAWDLEIGFRRMARRLEATSATPMVVVAGLALLLTLPPPAAADAAVPAVSPECETLQAGRAALTAATASEHKRLLAEVLQEPGFPHCEVRERWRWQTAAVEESPRPPATGWLEWLGRGLAWIIEFGVWLALGVGGALLVGWLLRLRVNRRPRRTLVAMPPPVVQGAEPTAETFATELGAAVWQLWNAGQPRPALALLYRGCLAGLSVHYGLQCDPAATEDECLSAIAGQLAADPDLIGFATRLTRVWQAVAYAHRLPPASEVHWLCAQWPQHFPVRG